MSETVELYLERLKPITRPVTESILGQWLSHVKQNSETFKGFTPDRLVEYQRLNPMSYEIMDTIQAWTRGLGHLRRNTIKRYYNAVVNYFAHNRSPLPPDPRFSVKNGEPDVVGDLGLTEIRRVIEASNPMYRAFWTCVAQGLMGIGEAVYWSDHGYDSLMAQLEAEAFPVRVDLYEGRKTNEKPFYTFIGGDGVKELKRYLEVRPKLDGPIFLTRYKSPLTEATARRYWNDTLRRLALIPEATADTHSERSAIRHGKNVHEVRDTMRSRWRLSGVDVAIAEWFMGHSGALDKYGYDKSPWKNPEWFEEKYRQAEPWLNLLSEDPEKVPRAKYQTELERAKQASDDRVQRLEGQLEEAQRALGEREARLLHVEQTQDLIMRALASPEAAPIFWKALKELEEKAERPR